MKILNNIRKLFARDPYQGMDFGRHAELISEVHTKGGIARREQDLAIRNINDKDQYNIHMAASSIALKEGRKFLAEAREITCPTKCHV